MSRKKKLLVVGLLVAIAGAAYIVRANRMVSPY
jgi:hypothetical protein